MPRIAAVPSPPTRSRSEVGSPIHRYGSEARRPRSAARPPCRRAYYQGVRVELLELLVASAEACGCRPPRVVKLMHPGPIFAATASASSSTGRVGGARAQGPTRPPVGSGFARSQHQERTARRSGASGRSRDLRLVLGGWGAHDHALSGAEEAAQIAATWSGLLARA
jgi:hypothetical protein